jgi:hypothetical protein
MQWVAPDGVKLAYADRCRRFRDCLRAPTRRHCPVTILDGRIASLYQRQGMIHLLG